MPNTQRAATALRLTIVAAVSGVPGDSLVDLNSAKLPNGGLIVIASTGAIYRYSATSTATANPSLGNVITPPNGVGRYIFVSGGASDPRSIQVTGTAALLASAAFAATQNTWAAFPTGANFYASTAGIWTVNTTTGVAIYSGPAQQFRILATATVSSATAAQSMELALSLDGASIGGTGGLSEAGIASAPPTTAGLQIELTTQRLVTVPSGSSIQPIVRNTGGSNNISVDALSLIAVAA